MKCIKKLVALTLAAVLALAMLTACSGTPSVPEATDEAKQVVDNINAVRTKNGLSALESNTAAMDVANKIAALHEKRELNLISTEDYTKEIRELDVIQVDGRGRDGNINVVSHSSGEKVLTEKFWQDWQEEYDKNYMGYGGCRIVRSAKAKYVGVAIKKISNDRYITVVVTY